MLDWLFMAPPGGAAMSDLALRLLVTALAGHALGWVYTWSHDGLSFKPTFVRSIVLLSLVVCVIVNVVGSSIAMTFGALAALAVVRFRTAVREPRDALFLFGGVVLGMTGGLGLLRLTGVAIVVLGLVAAYLYGSAYGTRSMDEGSLLLRYEGANADDDRAVEVVLKRNCKRWHLVKATPAGKKGSGAGEDRIYQVTFVDSRRADALIRELVSSTPVSDARVLLRAYAGEA